MKKRYQEFLLFRINEITWNETSDCISLQVSFSAYNSGKKNESLVVDGFIVKRQPLKNWEGYDSFIF